MPLPKPNPGEEEQHFVSRCIAFERNASPNTPLDQVQAMCYTRYRDFHQDSSDRNNAGKEQDVKDENADITNMTIIDLKSAVIDKTGKTIKHLSILSSEAFDTDGKVFRRFSDAALNDAVQVFEGSLARLDHDKGSTEPRGVRTGYGVYRDLKREGNKVFGDLHLWDCPEANKVLSIAERTPDAVGNSIHTSGIIRMEDDVEIVEQLRPRTKLGFKPSVDLVEDPASTVGLYNERHKSNDKEKDSMEYKDITLDGLRANRKDLADVLKSEGFASRDKEVKGIENERDVLTKKVDEQAVRQTRAEREIMVSKLLAESSLPDYAKTDVFRKQLMDVKESKDGDKTITVEDKMKELIQDRLETTEPTGVRDNHEKDLSQGKPGSKITDEEFADTFTADRGM